MEWYFTKQSSAQSGSISIVVPSERAIAIAIEIDHMDIAKPFHYWLYLDLGRPALSLSVRVAPNYLLQSIVSQREEREVM